MLTIPVSNNHLETIILINSLLNSTSINANKHCIQELFQFIRLIVETYSTDVRRKDKTT